MPGVQRPPFGSHGNLLICISFGDLMSHILRFVLKPQEPNLGRHRKAASPPKEDKRMGAPGLTATVLVPLGNLPSVPIKGPAGLTDNHGAPSVRSNKVTGGLAARPLPKGKYTTQLTSFAEREDLRNSWAQECNLQNAGPFRERNQNLSLHHHLYLLVQRFSLEEILVYQIFTDTHNKPSPTLGMEAKKGTRQHTGLVSSGGQRSH